MMLLTLIGFLLLVPPVAHLFNHDFSILGVPQVVFYLFGVWLALIIATWALTRRLEPDPDIETGEAEE
ncbi:MAG: hypothetical protein GX970_16055 [Phyllobacteriaceae bacterium]|nr:hypothetical protein [Phyllobacteriaceae bacterium]